MQGLTLRMGSLKGETKPTQEVDHFTFNSIKKNSEFFRTEIREELEFERPIRIENGALHYDQVPPTERGSYANLRSSDHFTEDLPPSELRLKPRQ